MSKRSTIQRLGAVAALLCATTFPSANAHHSISMFDSTKHVMFKGTVEKWLWSNPHSWIYIRVVKKDGTQEVWGFEASGTNMLAREGWNASDMKPGDVITVIASPERDGKHIGLVEQVQLPSGRVLKSGFGSAPPGAFGPPPAGAGGPPPGMGAPPPGSPPPGMPAPGPITITTYE